MLPQLYPVTDYSSRAFFSKGTGGMMEPVMFVPQPDMCSYSVVGQVNRKKQALRGTSRVFCMLSHMLINPNTGEKQNNCTFKAILGFIARICPRKSETKHSSLVT